MTFFTRIAPLAEAVHPRVERVSQRDVDDEHDRGEDQGLENGVPEREHGEHRDDRRGDRRAVDRPPPRGRLVEALGAAAAGLLA